MKPVGRGGTSVPPHHQRADKRYSLELPVQLVVQSEGPKKSYPAKFRDVSLGGARFGFESAVRFPSECRVEVKTEDLEELGLEPWFAEPVHYGTEDDRDPIVGARWMRRLKDDELEALLKTRADQLFAGGIYGEDIDKVILRCFGSSHPLANILQRCMTAGCNFCRAERDYVDFQAPEGHESFLRRYVRTRPELVRLHLWKVSGKPSKGGELIRYFGYVVLKDASLSGDAGLKLGHVGRTIIEYPEALPGHPEGGRIGSTGEKYFVNAPSYRYYFKGITDQIRSFEYRQQDLVTGSCGHTAVETASGVLRQHFGTPQLTSRDVHEVAKESGCVPSRIVSDLMEDQIGAALATTGCNVIAYYPKNWAGSPAYGYRRWLDERKLAEVLHIATESRLPAILVVRREPSAHAVVTVGHWTMTDPAPLDRRRKRINEDNRMTATHWVRDFLVHDDAVGPYLRLPIRQTDQYDKGSDRNPEAFWNGSLQSSMRSMFVPYPPSVILDPADALPLVQSFVTRWLKKNTPWSRSTTSICSSWANGRENSCSRCTSSWPTASACRCWTRCQTPPRRETFSKDFVFRSTSTSPW